MYQEPIKFDGLLVVSIALGTKFECSMLSIIVSPFLEVGIEEFCNITNQTILK